MDWLQKEILAIRQKLGEPVGGPVVGVVEKFKKRYNGLGTKQRREQWVQMSKETLAKLNAIALELGDDN